MTGVDNRAPRQGRLQREDLSYLNEADWQTFVRDTAVVWQAAEHGASVLTIRADVAQDVFSLGVNVPAGRRLTVVDRSISLTDGVYDIDVIRSANGFTGGTEGTQSRLFEDAPDEVQSRIFSGVTIDGAETVREQLFADVSAQGSIGRAAGAPAVQGVLKRYTEDVIFRITREDGGSDYTVAMMLIVWEDEAP